MKFGAENSLASMQSMVTLVATDRPPFTLMPPAVVCTVPAWSVTSINGFLPLRGKLTSARWVTTSPNVALTVVNATADSATVTASEVVPTSSSKLTVAGVRTSNVMPVRR